MARPLKQGLDYFPLDVGFFDDDKVEYVTARFDEKGELITIKLLCAIYKNGYYTNWNDDKALIFSKRAGKHISPLLANDVVMELVKRGFFDRSIFDSFGILTSKGIQRRFLTAIKDSRTSAEIVGEYWLIDIPNDTQRLSYSVIRLDNPVSPPHNPVSPPHNAQSKVKESKKEKHSSPQPPPAATGAGNFVTGKKPYPPDSKYYKAAVWLRDTARACAERGFREPSEPNLQDWADEFRKLEMLDKIPWDSIKAVLKWAMSDSFWCAQIQSGKTFRAKYNQLSAKMNTAPNVYANVINDTGGDYTDLSKTNTGDD